MPGIGPGASVHVAAGSPARAAPFPLIVTVALPFEIVPLLLGGFTKLPPIGRCGGVFVAVLFAVAAAAPTIVTLALTPPSMMPLNGCGTITGGDVPNG